MTQDNTFPGPATTHGAARAAGVGARGWRARLGAAGLRRRLSRRQATGMAEVSVLVVAASLITGLFVGDGLTRTAVDIADGVTWLTDDQSGTVIQVNPATGRLELPLKVAAAGNDLELGQYDNQLYVINHTTGEMSAIDVSTLVRSGLRRVSTEGAAETMTDGETVFLVDRGTGKISAIDPLTADELGTVWLEDEGLADAAIDDTGIVWSLDKTGRLTSLRWSETSLAFSEEDSQVIDGSGPGSVLVGHEEGVTVFGPDSGIVYQIGTGHDVIASSADLLGTVTAPAQSRSDLTAAAAPDSSTVVIVADDQVREVDVEGIGCADPGRPEVFHDLVYVPCLGEGKVIVLDAEGTIAQDAIPTPGSANPELVVDDDNLLINTPGAVKGLVVNGDRSITTVVRQDKDIAPITPQVAPSTSNVQPEPVIPPAQVPNTGNPDKPDKPRKEPVLVVDPEDGPTPPGAEKGEDDKDNGTGKGKGPDQGTPPNATSPVVTPVPTPGPTPTPTGAPTPVPTPTAPVPTPTNTNPTTPAPSTPAPTTPTTPPSTTTSPTTPPPATPTPAASTPTGVSASSVSATQVQVDWSYSGDTPDNFVIRRVGAGTVATVGGGQRQAVVTVTPGQASSFTVTANVGADSATSAASNTVTTSGAPGAPASVTSTSSWGGNGKIDRFIVDVSWTAAPDNGSPITGYRIEVTTNYVGGSSSTTPYTVGPDVRSRRHTEGCYTGGDPNADCSAADYSVTVTAINAIGDGPATGDTGSQPPPPPTLPAGGADHVTGDNMNWQGPGYEGFGTLQLTLQPPAAWASFAGTCSYTVSGGGFNGTETGAIPCGAASLDLTVNHGIVRSQTGGQVTHSYSITFTASNGVGTVDSARHDGTYTGSSLCSTCPIP